MELTQLQELISQIQQLQSIMIEVVTSARIQSKEDEYKKVYREVELKINSLKEEGWSISNPNAFKSLWEWYEYYRWSPKLDKPHLRQAYIHNLYSNVLEQIERASYKQIVANSPAETLQELEPSQLKVLISDIENLKEIMTIATDKREIEHEEEGYIEIYQKIALQIGMLHEIGLPLTNPNHFRSLWQWYSHWSSHSGNDSSEQEYVDSIYKDIIKTLRQYSSGQDEVIQNLKRRFSHQEPSQATPSISTSSVVVMNTLDEEPAEVTSLAEDVRDIKFPSSPQMPVQGSFPITTPTTQLKEHFLLDQPLEHRNSLDSSKADVAQVQDLTELELSELSDFLERSGQAVSESRRSLCIRLGIKPGGLEFINQTADTNFATQLVDRLYQTDNFPALFKLCNEIKPHLHGRYADRLEIIRRKTQLR